MTDPIPELAVAVVLAGGAARRYGSDKLAAEVEGLPLLDRTVAGLAPDRRVIIVGPDRGGQSGFADREVEFVPDDHPGAGPAAAMITGLRAAVQRSAELITVLPGDAPGSGAAAEILLARLAQDPALPGVLAVDRTGREQPLQFAVRRSAAQTVIDTAGPEAGAGTSARRLLLPLGLDRIALDAPETWDIDTPEQHRAWTWRDSAAVREIQAAVTAAAPARLILLGSDPAEVAALAGAVALARNGRLADLDATRSGGGWAAAVLPLSDRPDEESAELRIGLRGPGDAGAEPPDVDLWVTRPDGP